MSDTAHYRFQSDQARRLARQVTDAAVREKLLEMADEYGRYADLIEARSIEPAAVEAMAH
ncbi:ornithine carbamoyltransferase [Bradyrhizobium sp. USDA 4011]